MFFASKTSFQTAWFVSSQETHVSGNAVAVKVTNRWMDLSARVTNSLGKTFMLNMLGGRVEKKKSDTFIIKNRSDVTR